MSNRGREIEPVLNNDLNNNDNLSLGNITLVYHTV